MNNHLVISGTLIKTPEVRQTPAGVSIARCVIDHQSVQEEAGFEQEARCRIVLLAAGESLARKAGSLKTGDTVKAAGFITRASIRGEHRLVLHASSIEQAQEPATD